MDERLEWLRDYGVDPDKLDDKTASYAHCFHCDGTSFNRKGEPCEHCKGSGLYRDDCLRCGVRLDDHFDSDHYFAPAQDNGFSEDDFHVRNLAAKTRLVMPAVCPSCQSTETRGRYHRGGWREYTCLDCGSEFKNRDSRIAMPLYPSQLQKHIEQNGPYAYHTTSPDNIDNILRDGLKPGVEPQWDEHLQPRPGHVYMWTKDLQDCYMCGGKGKLGTAPHEVEHSCDVCEGSGKSPRTLRIDMRKLDPAKFASDEDEVVSREDADKIKQQWSDTSESLGDHVDKNKAIYDHPDMVERSLQGGSFAYHGHIPPDAIDVNPKWIQQAAWLDENNSEFKNRDSKIGHLGDDLGFHDQRDQWEQHLDTERAPDTSKIRDCASCGEPWGFVLSPSLGVYVRRHLDERESDHPLSKGHRPIEEHEIIRGIEAHVSDDKAMHHANPEQLRTDHPYWDQCGTCGGDGIQVGSTDVLTGEQKQSPCKDCGGIGEAYDAEYWDSDDQLHDFANYPNFHQMNIPDKSLKTHLKDVHQTDKGYDDAYVQHQVTHGINVDPAIAEILMPKAAAKTAEFDRTKYDEVQHVDPRWIVKNVKPVDDPTWKQNFDWNDIEGRHFLDDVKANGVNEPVHTKNQMDGGGLEMANGHHRVWAAIRAGLASVPLIHHDEYVQLEDTEGEGLVGHTECRDRDYQNSKEASKTAVNRTRSWYLKQRDALVDQVGPDKSDTVHEFGDGWTIKHLNTVGDARYEGTLMKNCIKDIGKHPCEDCNPYGVHDHGTCKCSTCEGTGHIYDSPHTFIGDALRGDDEDAFEMTHRLTDDSHEGRIYSLRDPDNIPQVSFTMHDKEDYDVDEKRGFGIESLNGRANRAPNPEHAMKVTQFFKDVTKDVPGYHTIEDESIPQAIHDFGQHDSPSATVSERRGCGICIAKHNREHTEQSRTDLNCPECREPRLFAGSKTAEFTPGDTTYPFAETQTPDFRPQPRGLDPWKDRGDTGVPLHNDMVFDPKLKKWINSEMSAMPAEVNYPGNGLMSQSSTENEKTAQTWTQSVDAPPNGGNVKRLPYDPYPEGKGETHTLDVLPAPTGEDVKKWKTVKTFPGDKSFADHPQSQDRIDNMPQVVGEKLAVVQVVAMALVNDDELPPKLRDTIEAFKTLPNVHRLQDPVQAAMRCGPASYDFAEFAKSRGHNADIRLLRDDTFQNVWKNNTQREHDEYQGSRHAVPYVDGHYVDWTARQYTPDSPVPRVYKNLKAGDAVGSEGVPFAKYFKAKDNREDGYYGLMKFQEGAEEWDPSYRNPRQVECRKHKNEWSDTCAKFPEGHINISECSCFTKPNGDDDVDKDNMYNYNPPFNSKPTCPIHGGQDAVKAWFAQHPPKQAGFGWIGEFESGEDWSPEIYCPKCGSDRTEATGDHETIGDDEIPEIVREERECHDCGRYFQWNMEGHHEGKPYLKGPGGSRIEGKTALFDYDPVRDVQPSSNSAPAPDATKPAGDPWPNQVHDGVNPDRPGYIFDKKLKKFIRDEQLTYPDVGPTFPGVTDINKVGHDNDATHMLCWRCHGHPESSDWRKVRYEGGTPVCVTCDGTGLLPNTHWNHAVGHLKDEDYNQEVRASNGKRHKIIELETPGAKMRVGWGDDGWFATADPGHANRYAPVGYHAARDSGYPHLGWCDEHKITGGHSENFDPHDLVSFVQKVREQYNPSGQKDAALDADHPSYEVCQDCYGKDPHCQTCGGSGLLHHELIEDPARPGEMRCADPDCDGRWFKAGQAHPQPVGMHEGDNGIDDPMKHGDPSQVKKIIPGTQRTVPETNVWNVSIDNLNKTGASNWPGLGELKRPWAEDRGYKAYDPWLMGGGCAHLALAMKAAWPEGKIAAAWYDDHGRRALSHAAFYDPKSGHAWDGTGAHKSADIAVSTHPGSDIEMDADPHKVAEHMGIDFSDEAPFADDGIADAWNTVDEHFMPASARTCRECGELGVHDTERGLCKDCATKREAAVQASSSEATSWDVVNGGGAVVADGIDHDFGGADEANDWRISNEPDDEWKVIERFAQAQQAADVDGEREPEEPKLTDRQLHVMKNHPMMAEEIASVEDLTAFADPELQQLHLQDHALNQHDHNPEVLRVAKRSS